MAYHTILVTTDGAVGLITLNRPEALNALNSTITAEISAAAAAFDADPAIGAVVLTGSDRAFAAGADIKELKDKTFAEVFEENLITATWEGISRLRKPVIAAVSGHAIGGGCELALMCDIIIAAETARFALPETAIGVIPGAGGTQRLTRIVGKAVAMDMKTAFDLEVKQHCPQAEVVYDLFHVVARYGREVVDRVRVEQANALKSDKPARKVVKSARWLLLRNRAKLSEKQDVKLQELLAANQPLAMVYVLKEALKGIWYAPSVWEGWRRWRSWMRQVKESGLTPLQRFGRNLSKYMRGILASANYPMHTSVLEGVNNKIKVIKRMAYGFRDSEYFFLKIKAAFPGKPR